MTDDNYGSVKRRLIQRLSSGDPNWLKNLANSYANDQAHANRILQYFQDSWFFVSSPVAVNVPLGSKFRGLPISCYIISCSPHKEDWNNLVAECEYIAKHGGGIGIDFSEYMHEDLLERIRELGTHINSMETAARYKASMAAYLHVSHPKIQEFIALREIKSFIDPKRFIHHGVTIPNEFMECALNNQLWNLKNGQTVKSIPARDLLASIVSTRSHTGEPYIFFVDHANDAQPECYKKLGLKIKTSNLCTEITLVTDCTNLTAICCLCTLNISLYDQWKSNTHFIEDVCYLMDNVMSYFTIAGPLLNLGDTPNYKSPYVGKNLKDFETAFLKYIKFDPIKAIPKFNSNKLTESQKLDLFERIQNTNAFTSEMFEAYGSCLNNHPLRKAFTAALLGRDIGIGGCGYSTYLQSKEISMETQQAIDTLGAIQAHIAEKVNAANLLLHEVLGPCAASAQTSIPCRFVNTTAIAPTTMTSQFCECSSATQPWDVICRVKSGYDTFNFQNPLIKAKLVEHKADKSSVWSKLSDGDMSVLKNYVSNPNVFKGPFDVNQDHMLKVNAAIGKHVSQSISINLFLPANALLKEALQLVILAWSYKLKTLYYLHSSSAIDKQNTLDKIDENICVGCMG